MQSQDIIFFLDKIGILAFAFTGVADGVKKKLDIFGLLVVGIATAIGGGIIRDLILAKIPYAISNIYYLAFAFGASTISILLFYFKLKIPYNVLNFLDTLGLGAFAAAGATVSLSLNLSILHTVFFAVITAVGGGLIKDIMLNEVPFILKREVYATAAGAGGLIIHIIHLLGLTISTSVLFGLFFIVTLRLYSIKKNLHLPTIK